MIKVVFCLFSLVCTFSSFGQSIYPEDRINICEGGLTTLRINRGLSSPSTYQWFLNGKAIPDATNSFYVAQIAGEYSVLLDEGKNTQELLTEVNVIVNAIPVADFISDFIPDACGNNVVQFTDKSANGDTYLWNFGDPASLGNNTSTEKDPLHRFVGSGGIGTERFTITLTVTSASGGCSDTTSMTINAKQSPDATLGGTGYNLSLEELPGFRSCGPQPYDNFTFVNLSRTKAINKNYRIVWGDETPDFSSADFADDISHKYDRGNYTLKFIIEGVNGCVISTDYNVFIGNNPTVGLSGPDEDAVCSGSPLQYIISETAKNSMGTKYVMTFGDGTKPLVFSQTTVPTVQSHTYVKTSCGSVAGLYPNAFEAIIIASNPCKLQEAVVRPIYVSEKPKASIGLSPGEFVCPNTTVKIVNNTQGNAVEDGQCSKGIPVWTIIPSTGWTLTTGSLGSDDNSDIVSRWTPGTDQLQVNFTEVGTYTILMKIGSTQCGIVEKTQKICVNPIPEASFTTDVEEGCVGPNGLNVKSTVTITEASKPTCGKSTYKWTVDYTPSEDCGDYSSLYEYINGTDSLSENPEFNFINPGVYTVGLIVSNSNGQCSMEKIFKTITVKGKPFAEINGVSSVICGNGSVIPTVNVKCFKDAETEYKWSFPGSITPDSDEQNPGTIVYETPGNYNISLDVNNECGISTFKVPVTVNPVPVIGTVHPNDLDRCDQANGTIQLTDLAKNTSFTTYYTLNGKSDSLKVESDEDGVVTLSGLDAGTYTHISVKAGGCISDEVGPITLNNAVMASPDFDLDQTNVCGPVKVHFTNNTSNLSAFEYTWDFGTGMDSSNLPNPGDVTFYPGVNGEDTVYIVKLSAGLSTCEMNTVERRITVKSRPIPFFSPDKSVGCSPMKVAFTNVSKGLTTKYYWDFGDGEKLETDKADQQEHIFTTENEKIYPVKLIAENGCGKDTFDLDIKVAPNSINLNVTMNGPDHAGCVPHTVTLYNNSAGGSSFEWDFGDGSTQSTVDNRDSVKHTYIKEGKYTIKLNASNSCSEKSTTDYVVVNTSPTASFIAERYKTCANQEIQFTNQSASATSYKWDFGDGTKTSDRVDPKHSYATPGFYRVVLTANRVNGPNNVCTETTEKIIEVSAPVIAIVGDAVNCTNVPLLFASNIQSNEKITQTTWELSNGATGNSDNFEYSFTAAGNYSLKLTATSEIGCSTSATKQIKLDPSPILQMSKNMVICQGKSTTLTVAGASSYEWTPSLTLSCSTCASPVASPINSTPYLVKGKNGFNCSTTGTIEVTVIEPFTLLTSSNDSICQGQTAHLRVSGADKYIWSPGGSLNDNLIANPIANPKVTTVYRVTGYDNYSCFSNTTEVKISVGEIPTIDLGPDKTLAAGTILPLTFKTNGVPIKSYLWSPPELLDCADCPNPNATIKRDISYSVIATTAYGCEATDIINITSICENTQVFIPNSFTPDGDGLNDILMVRGKGIARVKSFRIFNRLGEVVFERSDFPPNEPAYGWDGRLRGVLGSSAVYVYTAEVICDNGLSFIYKGNITVLK